MVEVLHINFYARKAVKEFMEEVEKYNPEMSWDNVYLGIVDRSRYFTGKYIL